MPQWSISGPLTLYATNYITKASNFWMHASNGTSSPEANTIRCKTAPPSLHSLYRTAAKKLHAPDRFHIISAHSDSPGFRVKPKCEMLGEGRMLRLNTEVYGGPILYTWFDRPLSLAGRVILRGDDAMHPVTRLVRFDRPMLTIPHLAIHFNRAVNEGNPYPANATCSL